MLKELIKIPYSIFHKSPECMQSRECVLKEEIFNKNTKLWAIFDFLLGK